MCLSVKDKLVLEKLRFMRNGLGIEAKKVAHWLKNVETSSGNMKRDVIELRNMKLR